MSVDGPALCTANDVLALSGQRGVISLDHKACAGPARWLEDALALPRARLVTWDRTGLGDTAAGLLFANGIAPVAGAPALWIAETRRRRLTRLPLGRYGDHGRREALALSFAPDNLSRGGDRVLAAGHPRLIRYALYRAGFPGVTTAPSAVAAISRDGTVTPLLSGQIDGFSGVTVAVRFAGRLVLGSGYDDRIAACPADF